MEPRRHSGNGRSSDEDEDDYFGGDAPLDAGAADGHLALKPLTTAAGGRLSYSRQCPGGPQASPRCAVDIPESMDFPQHGDGLCSHRLPLTYQHQDAS